MFGCEPVEPAKGKRGTSARLPKQTAQQAEDDVTDDGDSVADEEEDGDEDEEL